MSEIVPIPFRDGEVLAVERDGRPWVVLRPAFESIGLAPDRQIDKLRSQEWATTSVTEVVADDGRTRSMVIADLRTFLMALATIPASRVSEAARPTLIAYQREVAEVIERHFLREGDAYDPAPYTWTLDEVCALLRQRYNVRHTIVSLNAALRSSGLFKQVGSPKADYEKWFHFTGTAWTVHPHCFKKVAVKLLKLDRAIRASHDEQLALVGAQSPGELLPTEA
jgi:hypothetical protein